MGFDVFSDDGEAQACSSVTGGEERLERAAAHVLSEARAVVFNRDDGPGKGGALVALSADEDARQST